MILIELLGMLIAAVLFVLSAGIFYNERFKNSLLLKLVAGAIAIISTYFLGEQVWERLGDQTQKALIEDVRRNFDFASAELNRLLLKATQLTATARTPKSSGGFKDCEHCPEMAVVPRGSFQMGSLKTEAGHDENEEPAHPVAIAKAFAIGRFELTFDEWDACIADGGCGGYKPDDAGWGRGDRPVINVSWDDAQQYVTWLRNKTGKPYRLPSEAEWEYAARAGSSGPFSFGGNISSDKANYKGDEIYDSSAPGEFRGKTVPVRSFEPNAFGLYQVHGNVFEWVEDCWTSTYANASSDQRAVSMEGCERHVVRGGSWAHAPRYLRSADRGLSGTASRSRYRGFRVAMTLQRE